MSADPAPAGLSTIIEQLDALGMMDFYLEPKDGKWQATRITIPLETLGPFGCQKAGVKLSFTSLSEAGMYRVLLQGNLSILSDWGVFPSGTHGPISEIIPDEPRDCANIPADSTHYCWCYPPTGMTELKGEPLEFVNSCVEAGDPAFMFLAFGGFVYFKRDQGNQANQGNQGNLQVLRANALVQANHGMTFEGPFQWKHEYTRALFRQGRFEPATINSLKALGIKFYCYINPNEFLKRSDAQPGSVSEWSPCQRGGFVYLYDNHLEPHPHDCYFSMSAPPQAHPWTSASSSSTTLKPFSLVVQNVVPAPLRNSAERIERLADRRRGSKEEPIQEHLCVVCLVKPVACIFLPCKHICTCQQCGSLIKERDPKCPICRQQIREAWDVFL